jgi:predicted PurR-regulated permease PerM
MGIPHSLAVLLILGLYLMIVLIVMTLIWRATRALEETSRQLTEIAKDMKKLSEHFEAKE